MSRIVEKKRMVKLSYEGEVVFPYWRGRKIFRITSSRTHQLEAFGLVRIQIKGKKNRETLHKDYIWEE